MSDSFIMYVDRNNHKKKIGGDSEDHFSHTIYSSDGEVYSRKKKNGSVATDVFHVPLSPILKEKRNNSDMMGTPKEKRKLDDTVPTRASQSSSRFSFEGYVLNSIPSRHSSEVDIQSYSSSDAEEKKRKKKLRDRKDSFVSTATTIFEPEGQLDFSLSDYVKESEIMGSETEESHSDSLRYCVNGDVLKKKKKRKKDKVGDQKSEKKNHFDMDSFYQNKVAVKRDQETKEDSSFSADDLATVRKKKKRKMADNIEVAALKKESENENVKQKERKRKKDSFSTCDMQSEREESQSDSFTHWVNPTSDDVKKKKKRKNKNECDSSVSDNSQKSESQKNNKDTSMQKIKVENYSRMDSFSQDKVAMEKHQETKEDSSFSADNLEKVRKKKKKKNVDSIEVGASEKESENESTKQKENKRKKDSFSTHDMQGSEMENFSKNGSSKQDKDIRSLNENSNVEMMTKTKKKKHKFKEESVENTQSFLTTEYSVCDVTSCTEETCKDRLSVLAIDSNTEMKKKEGKKHKKIKILDNKENMNETEESSLSTDYSVCTQAALMDESCVLGDGSVVLTRASNTEQKKEKKKSKTQSKKSKTQTAYLSPKLKRIFEQYDFSFIDEKAKEEGDVREDLDSSREKTFNQNALRKLSNLKVLLPWPVPPLQLIETRVAGRPTQAQRQQIDDLGVAVKTGNFGREEDERIMKNFEEFCKLHDLPYDPSLFLVLETPGKKTIMPTEERINFVRFLAHRLENRLLCSVYNRFKRLTSTQKQRRFTETEDKQIVDYLRTSGSRTHYADLAKILNRDRLSIEKRFLALVEQARTQAASVIWKKEMIQEFMVHFVDILKAKDVEELKTREVTLEEWTELSRRLEISVSKLRRAWSCTIYPKMFTKKDVKTDKVKKRLLELLVEKGYDDWRSIKWDKIAKEFGEEGFTGYKLGKMLKHAVYYRVPKELHNDLKACVKHLQGCYLQGQKIKKLKVIDNR